MTTQKSADIYSGIFLAFVGAAVIWVAMDLKSTFGERLPPKLLPIVLGSTTLISGALLSIRAYTYRGEDIAIEWPDRSGFVRLLVTFLSITGYLVLMPLLGTSLSSLIFSTFLIWYLEGGMIRATIIGLTIAIIIELVFIRMLQLSLPTIFPA